MAHGGAHEDGGGFHGHGEGGLEVGGGGGGGHDVGGVGHEIGVLGNVRELDQTPTWAVASVCMVIILVSIILEKALHRLGQFFTRRKKAAMFEALEKVKGELMVLGFISLLLTFGQNYISRVCITEKAADTMLPCRVKHEAVNAEITTNHHHKEHLLIDSYPYFRPRRILTNSGAGSSCHNGKVSLVSTHGLHQLHIFIFFLAIFHVVYSVITMALGRAKIRMWKEWEKETYVLDGENSDPSRFRFTHETSFVRQHTSSWNRFPAIFYMVSFFRQFFRSVRKADYQALRHGFISVHLAPGSKFDFRKYIKRSLEDDFKVVVGISPTLWASAVIFLLLNVQGWRTIFWVSVMPLITILSVGTKLQAIITSMALEIKERHVVVQGIPLVQLTDQHFWFNSPRLVLFLIHLTLFQNAFQLIYFLWIWYEFGLNSCLHENFTLIVIRLCLGAGVQILCSYVTLPLYALVSQMGSHMKQTIFDEQTSKALKNWRRGAKKKQGGGKPGTPPSGGSPPDSPTNPVDLLKAGGQSGQPTTPSRRRSRSEQEMSEIQAAAVTANLNDVERGSMEPPANSTQRQPLNLL